MTAALGRLVTVPLREVWANEAPDFTPWLAKAENLALLAETLDLGELQIQDTEVSVGNFRIDILAKDIEGNVVVIENQFGPTDHTHLGQIMTYMGGQESNVTIIWIAEKFREEHRAAIDWLNNSTIEGFNFFAVEIQAMKIGSSLPAPQFNAVGKPNEWTRGVIRTTRQVSDTPLNERQKFYLTYWSQFAAFLSEKNSGFKLRGTFKNYWCTFRIGRAGVHFGATAAQRDKKIGVELYISRADDKATFRALEAERPDIERAFGEKLDWQELPEKTAVQKKMSPRAKINPSTFVLARITCRTSPWSWKQLLNSFRPTFDLGGRGSTPPGAIGGALMPAPNARPPRRPGAPRAKSLRRCCATGRCARSSATCV